MAEYLIIGSRCMENWFPDFKRKYEGDLDVLVRDLDNKPKIDYNGRIEYHVIPYLLDLSKEEKYLEPDLLYTLKMSHTIGHDIFWAKNEWDCNFLREKGCKLNKELFYQLYEYWNKFHGENKRSNLDMSAEDFFNNALKFPVEHDFLHELLIKHPYFKGQKQPTYTKILKEGAEVDVCMEKFNNLAEEEKFNVVFEEVANMALERFPRKMYYKEMYCRMLKKFIIHHAKLPEALWILENYKNLILNIPFDFKQFLWDEIDNLNVEQLKLEECKV
jgi:hypothetical protein